MILLLWLVVEVVMMVVQRLITRFLFLPVIYYRVQGH